MSNAVASSGNRRRSRDALMPASVDGTGRGFAIAVLVHLGLVVALAFGVSWRSSEPTAVQAELWAQVPVAAAPRAVEPPVAAPSPPPPPPAPVERRATPAPQPEVQRDAQIAIEQRRREQAERDAREQEQRERDAKARADREAREREREQARREAAEKQRQERAERQAREREAQAADARAEAQRQANLQRMQGMAGATGAPDARGTAAQSAGPSATYAGRIKAAIKPNIVFPDAITGNPTAEVEVRAGPTGTILGRTLTRSSGVREWDDAVLRAIDRTETLPRDVDGRVPPSLVITFRPRD